MTQGTSAGRFVNTDQVKFNSLARDKKRKVFDKTMAVKGSKTDVTLADKGEREEQMMVSLCSDGGGGGWPVHPAGGTHRMAN